MPIEGADRRRTTILFADVVGYSTIAEQLDPEDLQELITGTFAGLAAEVQRREGVVEKFIGDAVMATFGASPAHEDDPERAVTTAFSMLEVVRRR
jgi:adenylate cyclase